MVVKENYKLSTSYLFKLTNRTSLFLFLMLVVLTLFYVSGNFQKFLDSTQSFILVLCSFCAISLFLLSIAGFIESITLFFSVKIKSFLIFTPVYFLSSAFSLLCFMAFRLISTISKGI